jgi:ABC-type bacteriocin/lantibiotic exporter with double-glycine peptidase domain
MIIRYIRKGLKENQEKVAMAQSARMQKTRECFQNIKMLKLYCWEEKFQNRITDDYYEEMILQDSNRMRQNFLNIYSTLSTASMPIIVFATYIYSGNTMTLATVAMADMMIKKIRSPINTAINFYSNLTETQLSIDKIHEFLESEESQ